MNDFYKYENTPLPYPYNSLEPYIDQKTMEIHHDRHLQTYVNNLNKALENCPNLQNLPLEQLVFAPGNLPIDKKTAIKNNAGAVYNHRFYFNGMSNSQDKVPSGKLAETINKIYGSFDSFKKAFKSAALSVFGSGYAWLVVDNLGNIKIITTANQDTPLTLNLCPLLCIDVWEHAYYLKHYNNRGEYIDDWFNVVDWAKANNNYLKCINAL